MTFLLHWMEIESLSCSPWRVSEQARIEFDAVTATATVDEVMNSSRQHFRVLFRFVWNVDNASRPNSARCNSYCGLVHNLHSTFAVVRSTDRTCVPETNKGTLVARTWLESLHEEPQLSMRCVSDSKASSICLLGDHWQRSVKAIDRTTVFLPHYVSQML